MITDSWHNCYGEGWKGILNDAAFSHPAKFSRVLIRRIYRHAINEGWVREGDCIVDPFGGIAAGAYDAMRLGLHWIGCELEPRFCDLGRQNIEKWNSEHAGNFKKWGSAILLQGDSRRLCEILRTEAECCVSSPPYADGAQHTGGKDTAPENIKGGELRYVFYVEEAGQLGSMREGDFSASISSPPFGEGETRNRTSYQGGFVADMMSRAYTQDKQGTTQGNLSNLAATEREFSAAISSPTYNANHAPGRDGNEEREIALQPSDRIGKSGWGNQYGNSSGQLGAMPEGQFDASISSPPYEESMNATQKCGIDWKKAGRPDRTKPSEKRISPQVDGGMAYGENDGQLGIESGETFWSAAKKIVQQVHAVMKPGGKAIWVVKDYVKNKERVPFCDRWMLLCESVGFKTLHWHRAWLVEDYGTQQDLLGAHQKNIRERKSFFRRLAEKNGSPRIDFEVVLCMEKKS